MLWVSGKFINKWYWNLICESYYYILFLHAWLSTGDSGDEREGVRGRGDTHI